VKRLFAMTCMLGCSGRPSESPPQTAAPAVVVVHADAMVDVAPVVALPDATPSPRADHDLVGWATKVGAKLHLELAERDAVAELAESFDCKQKRPPFRHYVIEIEGGRAEGRFPATSARICPERGACRAAASAVVVIEGYVEQTGGGVGVLELTSSEGKVERDTIEYDYCYR
jgi:hypothetical protein